MDINMIVSDLDGTLFDSSNLIYDVSEALVETIEEFKSKGKIFTVATGRPVESTLKVLEKIKINAPYIVFNGAKIVDIDGNVIISETFPLMKWLPFLKQLQDDGASIVFSHNREMVCLKKTDFIRNYERIEGIVCKELEELPLDEGLRVNKVLIVGRVKRYIEFWDEYESDFKDEYCYVQSDNNYMEIITKGITKGSALKQLKSILNIKDHEVACIGNHLNDIELLQEAHIGYAVGNSREELKRVADYVTKGDHELGAIEAIRRCL